MAEVCFENVLACEDGEWIERRMLQPSLDPASAQRQIEEPFRRRSIFKSGFSSFKSMPAGDNDCQEALTSPTHRPLAARPQFNTDPFAKAKESTEPRQAHRSLDPLVEDNEKIAPDRNPPQRRTNSWQCSTSPAHECTSLVRTTQHCEKTITRASAT